MDSDEQWRQWVHATLIRDLSMHLVGNRECVEVATKTAREIGNQGFLWSLEAYTPTPPPEAAAALLHAQTKLFTAEQYSVLENFVADTRPIIRKDVKHTLWKEKSAGKPLLDNVDAPAAKAVWELLHPGATKIEIQRDLLVGTVQDGFQIFSKDNSWVVNRIKILKRATRGLAVRKRAQSSKRTTAKIATQ